MARHIHVHLHDAELTSLTGGGASEVAQGVRKAVAGKDDDYRTGGIGSASGAGKHVKAATDKKECTCDCPNCTKRRDAKRRLRVA
jgi:hypothetical protein